VGANGREGSEKLLQVGEETGNLKFHSEMIWPARKVEGKMKIMKISLQDVRGESKK
jgi:hypothetical protein